MRKWHLNQRNKIINLPKSVHTPTDRLQCWNTNRCHKALLYLGSCSGNIVSQWGGWDCVVGHRFLHIRKKEKNIDNLMSILRVENDSTNFHKTLIIACKLWSNRILLTLELLEYSADGAVIMPSMSPPSSGTLSLMGELESLSLPPPAQLLSRPSPSDWRTSLAALRFLSERSFPIGPGLYSL